MPSKQAIIENVDQYSVNELVGYIKNGIVTFDELCNDTEGNFSADVRKEVKRQLADSEDNDWQNAKSAKNINALETYLRTYPKGKHRDEARTLIQQIKDAEAQALIKSAWDAVDKTNISALENFYKTYPDDSHCREAKKIINQLKRREFFGFDSETLKSEIKNIQSDVFVIDKTAELFKAIKEHIDKKGSNNDFLNVLSDDHNILSASVINKLLEEGYITYGDLYNIGIKEEFLRWLVAKERKTTFPVSQKLEKINKVSTEVYFWGIPSSGKSCALGAIMSVAGSGRVAKTMYKDNDCQGYGYMTRLASLFHANGEVGTLPEGTSIYSTYEMGFDLVDDRDLKHPITCVDLAGELVRCMYKDDAKETLSNDELESLTTLTNVLQDNRSVNRKIHFFVLEYGGENRKYEGLAQKEYLEGALAYIERTRIFEKDTDAIYLMLTKVDKANAEKGQLASVLKKYVEDNYKGFYNGLKKICIDNEINNGVVPIVPFSLGEVCFQDYCLFDEKAAGYVLKILLERSKGFKNDKLSKITSIFRK